MCRVFIFKDTILQSTTRGASKLCLPACGLMGPPAEAGLCEDRGPAPPLVVTVGRAMWETFELVYYYITITIIS